MRGKRETVLLAVLPAIILLLGIAMYAIRAPIYAGLGEFDYDPAYVYLLSGLSLLNGYAPQHIDHPGTPMQMLCSALIAIYWLLTVAVTWESVAITKLVVSQPESVLKFISHTLLCLNVVATYFLGRIMYRATGDWMIAWLAQASILLLNVAFFHIMYLNGEALGIFATLLLLAVLVHESLDPRNAKTHGIAVPALAGSFVALAVTAKVTFLPLAVLLLSMRSWHRVRVSFVACILVTLILLAPIWRRLGRFAAWIGGISVHSGQYGTGGQSFVVWDEIPNRIAALAAAYPISAVTMIVLCAVTACATISRFSGVSKAASYPDDRKVTLRLLQVTTVAIVLQLTMVVKHFSLRYAIPGILLTAVASIFLGILMFRDKAKSVAKAYFGGTLAVVILATTWHLFTDFRRLGRAHQTRASGLARIENAIAQHERPLVVAAYRVRDRDFALVFGLGYVHNKLTRKILAVDHEHWSYNRWNGEFSVAGVTWKDVDGLESLARQGRTVLLLLPADVSIPGVRTETLVEIKGRERLLRVIGLQHD